jgi:hypothetical protein
VSWDKIEGHRSPSADKVRIVVHKPSGFNPYHQMRVWLGRHVLERLRWNVGVHVNAFHGTGKDAGKIRVSLQENGRFRLLAKRGAVHGSVAFTTNRLPPGTPERPHRITTARYEIAPDGSLEIEVPRSFFTKAEGVLTENRAPETQEA